ncbi:MAG: heavy-metal-associated domain-containing protein [Pirellulales bacterium]
MVRNMVRRYLCMLLLAFATVSGVQSNVSAADLPYTWIFITDMHCGNCAKKINAKLSSLEGVAKVQCDLENDFAVITPNTGANISPRQVWEAIEAIEFTPVKLQGPSGTFKDKPAN